MLVDGRRLEAGTRLRARVCVVGAGPAGITVAVELARAGVDVLLVEGGGKRATDRTQDTLRGEVDGDHDALDSTRQKRIGGTTKMWGGRCVPLDPFEFGARPWIAGRGWPIGASELDPYYRRAQVHCDAGAYEYDVDVAVPGAPPLVTTQHAAGSVSDERVWRWGPPVDFGARYRRWLSSSERVTLVHNADVVRLDLAERGGAVSSGVAVAGRGRELRLEADLFVIAGGGLETARLLLASNAQAPAGIGNAYDLVGRHYMTHPVAEVGTVTFNDAARGAQAGYLMSHDDVYCRRIVTITAEAQRREELRTMGMALWFPDPRDPSHDDGVLSAFALVRWALAKSGRDWKSLGMHRRYLETGELRAHLGNVARQLPRTARFGATWVRRRYLAHRRLPSFAVPARSGRFRVRFDAEQSPEPENRVTLTRDLDASSMPRLLVRHRVGDDDRESIIRSLHIVRDELTTGGIARVELPPDDEIRALAFPDGTHQMGLTRMADSPRDGVVDRDCKVHDVDNLYVAGSSVFPVSGFEAPTLTIVALAARLADHLAARSQPDAVRDVRDVTSSV